jgi:hypothetical protein
MKKNEQIYFQCVKCKKYQEPNVDKSNDNWTYYENVPCECGGEFRPVIKPEIV